MTAVYSPAQAFLAAQVRASFAIPYYNRMKQQMPNTLEVIGQIIDVVRGSQTQVLAASFKSVEDVIVALAAGIEHITLPLDLILGVGRTRAVPARHSGLCTVRDPVKAPENT